MERKIDRLIKYMSIRGLNDNRVTKECGLSVGLLNQARKGKSDLGDKAIAKILSKYQDINKVWLLTGEGEMLKSGGSVSPTTAADRGVPLYEADFALGFLTFPDSAVHPARYVTFPGTENATCWCRATGDSMRPMIDNGDYVCLRRIEDTSLLFYGEVYAIDCTNDMRTIKKIGRGSAPDMLRLTAVNPEYDEQELPLSLVRNIFSVVAVTKFL